MVNIATRAMSMLHKEDPKEVILRTFEGAADRVQPLLDDVLVAVYKRPERLASGLYVTEAKRDEDRYQGKVGLILSMGPIAEKDEDWGGIRPKVGDWVAFPVARSWPTLFSDGTLRFVPYREIKAILTDPDAIY